VARRSRARIRRSPFLVTYWEHDVHVAYNYLSRTSRECSPLVVAILDAAGEWTSQAKVRQAVWKLGSAREIARTIKELVWDGTLESSDRRPPRGADALLEWDNWNPAAGFFHAVTQSAAPDLESDDPTDAPMLVMRDFPDTIKRYDGRRRIKLPLPGDLRGEFGTVLRRRRVVPGSGSGHRHDFGIRPSPVQIRALTRLSRGIAGCRSPGSDVCSRGNRALPRTILYGVV
jgi:hypothetical protein